ncbi:MAG: hypothetical protein K2X48_12685 [Chitinophagaceae bacterium]|nr:hypothetical protein [Chitinophagaceae bacterium]
MELESLKTIWKDVGAKTAGTSAEELEQLLSKKSKSPIAKLKRNLFWELMVVLVLYSGTIAFYFVTYKGVILSMAWMLIIIGAAYIAYYVRKRRLLKNMECVTCEVKSNLSAQLKTLEKLVKMYLWIGTLIFPVVMMLSFVVWYFYFPEKDMTQLKQVPYFTFFYMLVSFLFTAGLTIPVYFLNKWYVHKLYGQHVKKLRQIVNEMNEFPFTAS